LRRIANRTVDESAGGRWQQVSAVLGLCLSVGAAACVALALAPRTPGRVAYYALLGAARLPRAAALGGLGAVLAAPGAGRGFAAARVAVGLGVLSMLVGGVLSAVVLRTARIHRLSLSVSHAVWGSTKSRIAPQQVTFTNDPQLQLDGDLYRPPSGNARSSACIVVVHGGAWRHGDKGECAHLSRWLAQNGYVVLDIQYRLAGAATWNESIEDIRAAINWLRKNAIELGIDTQRIALLGRSAGGHLALLAGYTAEQSSRPWRIAALYAPTDLAQLFVQARGRHGRDLRDALCALLGGTPETVPDIYQRASPLTHVHPAALPTLLIHGAWDSAVPPWHSQALYDALQHARVSVDMVAVPCARHAFDLIPAGLPTQLAGAALLKFLR
jgi:acetyl esterase/lipase